MERVQDCFGVDSWCGSEFADDSMAQRKRVSLQRDPS
jgi:hypothetical protein